MSAEQFVARLQEEVLADNLATYRRIFETSSVAQARDPYWKRALGLYATLEDNQRQVLFEIIRQVQVDTMSNVLGVIDGVNCPKSLQGSQLTLLANGKDIGGDLQATLISEVERCPR